jgi:hypothetical protein
MKIGHGDEVSDISIPFIRSFYTLKVEINALSKAVVDYLF